MLTVGALALAVITPALDPVEHDAVMTPMALPVTPEHDDRPPVAEIERSRPSEARSLRQRLQEFQFDAGFVPATLVDGMRSRQSTVERASRAMPRRSLVLRPAPPALRGPAAAKRLMNAAELSAAEAERRQSGRPETRAADRPARRSAERPERRSAERPEARAAGRREAGSYRQQARAERRERHPAERLAEHPGTEGHRTERAVRVARSARKSTLVHRKWTSFHGRGQSRRVTRGADTRIREMRGRDMRAVIAYARSQVGKRYVRGGDGPGGFDCSGLTKRAFAKAGLRLPHSSGGQARRARAVSRSAARPGDLVVGRGHVGIYMGKGMMIDAGNSRTGVVYRKVYDGLSVSRLG